MTAALCRQTAAAHLLLLLSDGKPNDVDMYDGRYGIEDTRQAVAEARRQGVKVFCLTVDREAPRYALRIFGRAGFSSSGTPSSCLRSSSTFCVTSFESERSEQNVQRTMIQSPAAIISTPLIRAP